MKPLTQFGEADYDIQCFSFLLCFDCVTESLCVCVKGQDHRVMPTNTIFEDKEKLLSPYRWGLKECV